MESPNLQANTKSLDNSSTTGDQQSAEQRNLLSAKLVRKKIEEDTKLLENRIALLELEEKKSKKKIEETKKKAEEIKSLKLRNKEAMLEKQAIKEKDEAEMNQKAEELKKFKESNKKAVEEKKQQHQELVKKEAGHTKKIKTEVKQRKNENDEEWKLRNSNIAQTTKNREKELVLRKQEFKAAKIHEVKKEISVKIDRELELKQRKEQEIAELERREMELIKRLQNTQGLQKQAFEDLEKALTKNP